MTDSPHKVFNKKPRWWPAVIICAVLLIIIFFTDQDWNIGSSDGDNHQEQVLKTIGSTVIGLLLLLIWALFFARFSAITRLKILGCLSLTIGIFLTCFRFSQFSGNMVPIFEWRWSQRELPTTKNQQPENLNEKPEQDHLAKLSFSQFLGPNRDCKIPGSELATDWVKNPPKQLWRQPIGAAWSGFSISGHRAITQEQREENETVTCYHIETGEVLWMTENPGHYNTSIAGEGPRATPAIVKNKVFALGAEGTLSCLELANGKKIWQRNLVSDAELDSNEPKDQTGASKPRNKSKEWGFSSSPLVIDDKVIVSAGGENGKSLIAYDINNGNPIWKGGSSPAGYSSAITVNINKEQQVLIFNHDGLSAHSPENGNVLWTFPWSTSTPHVAVPLIISENKLLVSLGYGNGSKLIEVSQQDGNYSTKALWHSRRMKAKFTNLIFHNKHVFGLDDGIFSCMEIEKGRPKWKDGRYGHGQILLRNSHILVMAENGELIMLDANPEKHTELTRFTALDGKTWNPPALAGEYLLVRNHREAACYKLPLKSSQIVTGQ
ncbi:MAG: PQQ-binding-like beta-propeller repeat protein [Verrucomicrobiota bacterium]|nr:PQQ-binding-like beta-propeller repeat protein [Verrucomicrobiota bacterium]MEE2614359.1 PQQ-binding-like beta-propeller repeat protein [Verrucomicrobiota bacterium]